MIVCSAYRLYTEFSALLEHNDNVGYDTEVISFDLHVPPPVYPQATCRSGKVSSVTCRWGMLDRDTFLRNNLQRNYGSHIFSSHVISATVENIPWRHVVEDCPS
nr:hypothetical protein [Tanacetum cinerariifolium]